MVHELPHILYFLAVSVIAGLIALSACLRASGNDGPWPIRMISALLFGFLLAMALLNEDLTGVLDTPAAAILVFMSALGALPLTTKPLIDELSQEGGEI